MLQAEVLARKGVAGHVEIINHPILDKEVYAFIDGNKTNFIVDSIKVCVSAFDYPVFITVKSKSNGDMSTHCIKMLGTSPYVIAEEILDFWLSDGRPISSFQYRTETKLPWIPYVG